MNIKAKIFYKLLFFHFQFPQWNGVMNYGKKKKHEPSNIRSNSILVRNKIFWNSSQQQKHSFRFICRIILFTLIFKNNFC